MGKNPPDLKTVHIAVVPALGINSPNCPHCGAPPSEHEVRNHSLEWHDGDVYCTKCGGRVRDYDAG